MTTEGSVFFFNDTATTEIYTLSLHDALPICCARSTATVDSRVGEKHSSRPWSSSTTGRRRVRSVVRCDRADESSGRAKNENASTLGEAASSKFQEPSSKFQNLTMMFELGAWSLDLGSWIFDLGARSFLQG